MANHGLSWQPTTSLDPATQAANSTAKVICHAGLQQHCCSARKGSSSRGKTNSKHFCRVRRVSWQDARVAHGKKNDVKPENGTGGACRCSRCAIWFCLCPCERETSSYTIGSDPTLWGIFFSNACLFVVQVAAGVKSRAAINAEIVAMLISGVVPC